MNPVHLDLFSGIGGFSLAADWAGFETVLFCEIDPFCRKVLAKHWPEVPCHDDIHTLTADVIRAFGIGNIDLLTGGFPCQPYSIMGKRGGATDDRAIWPEMLRVISECRPTFVCAENVAHFVNMGLDTACVDLEAIGYEVWPLVFPACAVGADFIGYRAFLLAASTGERGKGIGSQAVLGGASVSLLENERGIPTILRRPDLPQPSLLRSFDGISCGVDRLRALGNAVVPQQAYPILAAIAVQLKAMA